MNPIPMIRSQVVSIAVAAATAVASMAAVAPAWAQTFTFTGEGAVTPAGPPVGNILPLIVINTAYDLPGAGVWSLVSNLAYDLVTQSGSGTFSYSMGADSISGTFTSAAAVVAGGPGFDLDYTVTSGTGAYGGLTGFGTSVVRLLDNPAGPPPYDYLEAGIFSLVPEPATAALMLLGVAGLLHMRRRRALSSAAFRGRPGGRRSMSNPPAGAPAATTTRCRRLG